MSSQKEMYPEIISVAALTVSYESSKTSHSVHSKQPRNSSTLSVVHSFIRFSQLGQSVFWDGTLAQDARCRDPTFHWAEG